MTIGMARWHRRKPVYCTICHLSYKIPLKIPLSDFFRDGGGLTQVRGLFKERRVSELENYFLGTTP